MSEVAGRNQIGYGLGLQVAAIGERLVRMCRTPYGSLVDDRCQVKIDPTSPARTPRTRMSSWLSRLYIRAKVQRLRAVAMKTRLLRRQRTLPERLEPACGPRRRVEKPGDLDTFSSTSTWTHFARFTSWVHSRKHRSGIKRKLVLFLLLRRYCGSDGAQPWLDWPRKGPT